MTRVISDIDGVELNFCLHIYSWFGKVYNPPNSWYDTFIGENWQKITNNIHFWSTLPPMADPNDIDYNLVARITHAPCSVNTRQLNLINHGFQPKPLFVIDYKESKVPKFIELKGDIMIEDKPENWQDFIDHGIICLLIDRNYNKEVNTDYIENGGLRIRTLKDVSVFINLYMKKYQNNLKEIVNDK